MLILIVIDSVNNIGIIMIIIIVINEIDNDLLFSSVLFSVSVVEDVSFGISVVRIIVSDVDFGDVIIYVLLGNLIKMWFVCVYLFCVVVDVMLLIMCIGCNVNLILLNLDLEIK